MRCISEITGNNSYLRSQFWPPVLAAPRCGAASGRHLARLSEVADRLRTSEDCTCLPECWEPPLTQESACHSLHPLSKIKYLVTLLFKEIRIFVEYKFLTISGSNGK